MRKWIATLTLLLFVAASGWAGSEGGSPPGGTSVSPNRTPPAPIVPPPKEPPPGIEGGRMDYRANCAICHGSNALWAMKTARRMRVEPRKLMLMASELKREDMVAVIEKGRGKMPAFEKVLTKARIGYVVDYIIDFRAKRIRQDSMIRQRTPVAPTPAPQVPLEKGPATP